MALWNKKAKVSLIERSAKARKLLDSGVAHEVALREAGLSGTEFLYAESLKFPHEWRAQLASAREAFRERKE